MSSGAARLTAMRAWSMPGRAIRRDVQVLLRRRLHQRPLLHRARVSSSSPRNRLYLPINAQKATRLTTQRGKADQCIGSLPPRRLRLAQILRLAACLQQLETRLRALRQI